MSVPRQELVRVTLGVLFIAALIGACLWILKPFLPAILWATTLVIATWPIMTRLQSHLKGSRGLAVAVMTFALLLVFVLPFWAAIGTIVVHSDQIIDWGESLVTATLPPPPDWLGTLPLIGTSAALAWQNVADSGLQELIARVRPYAGDLTQWFLGAVGSFGMVLFQFLLTVGVAAIMYSKGERAAAATIKFGRRLAGQRGEHSVRLGAQAIRGVALGVVVTAFIQAAIGAFGLLVAGVPFAPVLCALTFMLCIAQLGPVLVLVPAVIWSYWYGDPLWATVLLICTVIAVGADNVLRPILIKRGVDLPLLVILAGVIGGLVAFGLIGIFLGPTILAVGYTLLGAWIDEVDQQEAG